MDALSVLGKLGGGHLMETLHAAIIDVAEQVIATEKSGTVTLTLKLKRVADMPAVTIEEQVKTGPPVPAARGALFFALDGELHTRDPRQAELNFRLVDDPQTGVRTLDDDASDVREAR